MNSTGLPAPNEENSKTGGECEAEAPSRQEADGRELWQAASRYADEFRCLQRQEAWYLLALLLAAFLAVALYALGLLHSVLLGLASAPVPPKVEMIRVYYLLCAGGLFGGTVYGAKWLYHAVAKGLWHEDRRLWRFLSPWISLGTTFGVGALLHAGFFRLSPAAMPSISGHALVGTGFVIGYLSDKALAKMKDLADVLFGDSKSRPL